jgi:hypothetical protein
MSLRLPVMYYLRDEGKGEGSAAKVVAFLGITSSWFGLQSVLRDNRLLRHQRGRRLAVQNRIYVV